jgi:pyroglutamyl-peptidase
MGPIYEISVSLRPKKIIVTGFEPFLGETVNPSQVLLREFSGCGSVKTLLLPVSFEKSWPLLLAELEKEPFDFVLMLGQAGGRSKICLERVAINLIDCDQPDEEGIKWTDKKIIPEAPTAYLSPIPVRKILDVLRQAEIPSDVSFSAGAFVCNYLYFQSLDWLSRRGQMDRALFVHIPYLPEQVMGKSATVPSLGLGLQRQALFRLLDWIVQWRADGAIK